MGSIGLPELVVIFVIILFLFGGSRLPGIAKGLGGAVHSFKKAMRGDDDERALSGRNDADKVPSAHEESSRKV